MIPPTQPLHSPSSNSKRTPNQPQSQSDWESWNPESQGGVIAASVLLVIFILGASVYYVKRRHQRSKRQKELQRGDIERPTSLGRDSTARVSRHQRKGSRGDIERSGSLRNTPAHTPRHQRRASRQSTTISKSIYRKEGVAPGRNIAIDGAAGTGRTTTTTNRQRARDLRRSRSAHERRTTWPRAVNDHHRASHTMIRGRLVSDSMVTDHGSEHGRPHHPGIVAEMSGALPDMDTGTKSGSTIGASKEGPMRSELVRRPPRAAGLEPRRQVRHYRSRSMN
ncbi:hypothetical protein AJ80_02015 [Polytolypa hystricis UAMH7299]|uniref:Uncharacterized protein n=1 Tax=Polytolypa hystricis (strain UAMH7299) TaxID=1447883 RepID=A0A2B7YSI2_POLH7|nr:hypothetical protein AJ80_02015 [Polytolypa hystricis UAMH7299]